MSSKKVYCPQCQVYSRLEPNDLHIQGDPDIAFLNVEVFNCPECHEHIIHLAGYEWEYDYESRYANETFREVIYPNKISNFTLHAAIPLEIAQIFQEANEVLGISTNGSACLSRRCLQSILRANNPQLEPGKLFNEIEYVTKNSNSMPQTLLTQLGHIRELGNFGAHEERDSTSFEIINVEKSEAEYLLSILRNLMDFYYVQPAEAKARDKSLKDKKKRAGKKT